MIKSPSVHSNDNSLHNTDNYKKTINKKIRIIDEYSQLIYEYLELCKINISIKNETYLKYVIVKGIEAISHIFNTLMLYTKNLELVSYHCNKASHYYIEFIDQIGEDSHSFLQLSCKDAILFIYKKTIFDINNDIRKDFNIAKNEDELFIIIKNETEMINNLLFDMINKETFLEKTHFFDYCIYNIKNLSNKISILKKYTNEKYITMSNNILLIIEKNKNINISFEKTLPFLEIFIKKNSKLSNNNLNIEDKLRQFDLLDSYENSTPNKFINTLLE